MGEPAAFNFIELGPGRGTLMADILRAAKIMPAFAAAARIHLVELSPSLHELQARTVPQASWHESLDTIPEGPRIIIANEFFDAIPIRQFEYQGGRWMERCIGLNPEGGLVVGLVASPETFAPEPEGAVIEISPARLSIGGAIGSRLNVSPGAALIIDYGHCEPAAGDTLQAVRDHRYCGILDYPGDSDLTSHVDFQALASALAKGGATVYQAPDSAPVPARHGP